MGVPPPSPIRVRSLTWTSAFMHIEQLLLIEVNYRTLIYPPPQTWNAKTILLVMMGVGAKGKACAEK